MFEYEIVKLAVVVFIKWRGDVFICTAVWGECCFLWDCRSHFKTLTTFTCSIILHCHSAYVDVMDLILVTQHILFGYSESRLISAQHEVRTLRSLPLFFSTFFESLRMQSIGEGADKSKKLNICARTHSQCQGFKGECHSKRNSCDIILFCLVWKWSDKAAKHEAIARFSGLLSVFSDLQMTV